MNSDVLTKLGEQQVLQSKIKEKFREMTELDAQMKQLRGQYKQIINEIEDLAVQAQDVADWLLEQEYHALTAHGL